MGLTQINEFFLKSEALERHSAGLQNEGECHAMPRMTLTCYHNQIKAMQTNTHTQKNETISFLNTGLSKFNSILNQL